MNKDRTSGLDQATEFPAQGLLCIGKLCTEIDAADSLIESIYQSTLSEPDNPVHHYELALVLDSVGRLEEAVSFYRRALELAPAMLVAYNNLGVALYKSGKFALAKKLFIYVTKAEARTDEDILLQSAAYYNLGKKRKAVKLYLSAHDAGADGIFSELRSVLLDENTHSKSLLRSRKQKSEGASFASASNYSFRSLRPAHALLGFGLFTAATVPAVIAFMPASNPVAVVKNIVTSSVVAAYGDSSTLPFSAVPSERRVQAVRQDYQDSMQPASVSPVSRANPVYDSGGGGSSAASSGSEKPSSGGSKAKWDDDDDQDKDYNIQIGPVGVDISATAQLEFNDNISSSGVTKNSDVIARLNIDFDTELKLSKNAKIGLVLGMAYQKYLDNSNLDSQRNFINLSDGTELSFKAKLGSVKLKVYDRVTFSIDATDARSPTADGGFDVDIEKFGRFVNVVGGKATWTGKQFRFSGGLEREDVIPTEDEFRFTRSIQYNTPVIIDYKLAKDKVATLNLAYFNRKYPEQTNGFRQNNATGYLVQPAIEWEPSSVLKLKLAAGVKRLSFSESGSNGDSSDASDFVYSISAEHQINKNLSHDIKISQDTRFGLATNSEEVLNTRYNIKWKANKKLTLNGGLTYEHGKESGSSGDGYDRYVAEVGATYLINQDVSATANYYYTTKKADTESREYDQNKFLVGVKYDF